MATAVKRHPLHRQEVWLGWQSLIIAVITDMGITPKIRITRTNQALQMFKNLEAIIVSLEFPTDIRGCDALVDLLEGNQVVIFFLQWFWLVPQFFLPAYLPASHEH